MKNKLIYKYVGKVILAFSLLLIIPLILAFYFGDNIYTFLIPIAVGLIIGGLLSSIKVSNMSFYAKDGFIIVAISWIIISIIGALPFYVSNDISFIDALFESISGLTTTGASAFNNVEIFSKSILFYRCYTHFIGGMGVLAFVMAIVPLSRNDKSMNVLKAEMPGPSVAKLVPGMKKTLLYLYGIYIGLTSLEVILLLIGDMSLYDSILLSMSTAGTGGFSMLNSSIATYGTFNQYVIAIFMLLFGVNFNIYFLILIHNFKNIFKSEELKYYMFILAISVVIILLSTFTYFTSFSDAIKESFFHVSSVMTSTGFSIGDINIYPTHCRILILSLMLISACAGSTCGGFKISRLIICLKKIKRDFIKAIHPNSVHIITFDGKKVDEDTVNSTCTYLYLYALFIVIIMFIVSFDEFGLETTISAVFSTFANVGISFNLSSFSIFSNLSKIVLSIGMLLGRLEIYPLIVLFSDLKK